MLTPWFKQDEFGKTAAFLSIHASVIGSNLGNSSKPAQPAETEGKRTVGENFSEQIFSLLICSSFLPWSGLNLKEKSVRVILVEFNFDKML